MLHYFCTTFLESNLRLTLKEKKFRMFLLLIFSKAMNFTYTTRTFILHIQSLWAWAYPRLGCSTYSKL